MDKIQEEIKQFIIDMNACWTAGNPADLTKYFHPDIVAITPMDELRREGREACIEGWANFAKSYKILSWKERDMDIRVYNNAAVVSYYYDISFEASGAVLQESGRDMFFLIKEDNRWLAVADQFSSMPE